MKHRGYRSINLLFVINLLGRIVTIEGFFMLLPIIFSIYYKENITVELVISALVTIFSGLLIFFLTRNSDRKDFSKRESFLLVTLSWIIISLFGLIPFVITGELNFTDAFFETVSGFTTTGASNLFDIEALPKSLLFWRSETHWIGGMGIIVLFVALFPFLKTGRLMLFNAEASVVVETKAFPRLLDISRTIWLVYFGLTVLQTVLLMFGGMNLYESLSHAFGTMATGGFSTRSASVGAFSPYIQYVIIVFMIFAGINFSLYIYLIKRNFSKFFKNEELKYYIIITLIATIAVFVFLFIQNKFSTIEETFRHSIFQVVSILTTTGYGTSDYLYWPHAAIAVILLLMFVGASAGSTTGNMKVIRHVIFIKNLKNYFRQMIHPDAVSVVRYNKKVVPTEVSNSALVFILAYILIVFFSTIFVSFFSVPLDTSFGAVVATIGCIGPGLGDVGPAGTYFGFSPFLKYFLSFLMILGRLEIFTVIVIFTRSFWKG